jgi:hypothetical protein
LALDILLDLWRSQQELEDRDRESQGLTAFELLDTLLSFQT